MAQLNNKVLLLAGVVVVGVVAGYYFMTRPDTRTTGERLDDAINEFNKGAENAVDQLDNRSTAEKLKDKLKGQ